MKSTDEQDAENIWNSASEANRAKWLDIVKAGGFTTKDLGLWDCLSSGNQDKVLNYFKTIAIVPDLN